MINQFIVGFVMLNTYVFAQCSFDTKVLEVTRPTGITTDCKLTTVKKYQLVFENVPIDLTYQIDDGVYTIDTLSRGATLSQISESGVTKDYQLISMLIRSPPIFKFNNNLQFQVEMQMQFNNTQSTSDDIIFSFFFSVSSSSSSKSSFFSNMDLTIIGEKQSVNLFDTLKNDLSGTKNIYEYNGVSYLSQTLTWLISDQSIIISQQDYDAIVQTWSDPYVLKKFDNININNGVCLFDKAQQYAFCMNGIKQAFSFVALFFVLLI